MTDHKVIDIQWLQVVVRNGHSQPDAVTSAKREDVSVDHDRLIYPFPVPPRLGCNVPGNWEK